jgi:hypothetical protein
LVLSENNSKTKPKIKNRLDTKKTHKNSKIIEQNKSKKDNEEHEEHQNPSQ